MRNIQRWALAGVLTMGGLGGVAFAHGTHKKLTMDQLPSPVQSTFQKEAAGGQIEDLHSKTYNGKTIYEGEIVSQGKGTELKVSEDGSVLKRSAPHDEATEKEHGDQE
jgi:hypothetical protein